MTGLTLLGWISSNRSRALHRFDAATMVPSPPQPTPYHLAVPREVMGVGPRPPPNI